MLKLILKAGNGNRENPNSHCTETHQQLESQRRELLQAIQWADQAQRERERINLCGELEMRNRLRYERQVKTNQEIEELQSICNGEANQIRRLHGELSLRQERNPNTVSRLLKQIQELQDQVNSLAEAKEFHDPDTASSSGASHVPSQPVVFPSSREMLGRDSGLPTMTLDTTGNSGNISGAQQLVNYLPQLSSNIREIRLLRIVDWDLRQPRRPWER